MTGINIDTHELQEFVIKFPREMQKQTSVAHKQAGQILAGAIRREIKEWTSNSGANISTGHLARSYRPALLKKGEDVRFGVYSNLPYAAIHEEGGTIKAKSSEFLHFKIGRGRKANWVKVRSVKITAKRYLKKAAERAGPDIERLIGKQLQVALNRAAK